ncbi:unnamed protein product [Rotaria socialis]|uniref:Mos1 transposase HTH domain-containing protein n=1 Tax=Rotaria socialis TaxID=392032 RepID=A0A820YF57_9BILA|nr:unnamed protein product [Rotaria socialis]
MAELSKQIVIIDQTIPEGDLTRSQIRVMIHYDYKKKWSQEGCLESSQKTFGDSCVSRTTVYRWYAEFNSGRNHFEDERPVGRPSGAVTPENIEAIQDTLQIGSAATETILHDYLGLRKITCRWVPHFLTEAQKQDRVDYCQAMLEKFDGGRSKQTKRQSQVWVARNDPQPTNVRRQRSFGKLMFAIFFMKPGFNTIIPLESDKTVTAKWYTDEYLSYVLKQTTPTMEFLNAQRVKLMGHPTYSPDLSPCDFWLFPKIKEQLCGKNFKDIDELHATI